MSINIPRLPPRNNTPYSSPQPPNLSSPFSSCYAACQAGNLIQMHSFFKQDPSLLSQIDSEGQTLFYACAEFNRVVVMRWLYQQNPLILKICRPDGQSPMHIAAARGHLEAVQWLHEQNLSFIEQTDKNQLTPLHVAAFHEEIPILKIFTKKLMENVPLIQQIAQKNCPKSLAFVLEQGIDPNTMNSSQQTLLHLAADAGQEKNVLCLLQHGAKVDARDLSKRTPLFCAVVQGNHGTMKLLIHQNADITVVNEEKETLLHAAAFYGHMHVLKELLDKPACKNLIEARDHDGKTPLQKAVWGTPKPNIINLLIAHGAILNTKNNYNYTPLHWAAKHGHIKSAQILLNRADLTEALNANNHLPFDLAVRFGQDDFIHFFLGTKTRLQVGKPPSADIEGFYSKCLLEAKKQNLVEEQILYLQKLSDLYIEKENFLVGAKILNCALALLDNKNSLFENYLMRRLEEIEKLFLKSQGVEGLIRKNAIKEVRSRLMEIRKDAAQSHQNAEPIHDILKKLSEGFKHVLSTLINEVLELLGPPPVKWACIGMGSMSRAEMCPYSDIEFAFLIKKETPKALEYFRTLSRILELKIINLGETKFPVFGGGHDSPTPDGFCMDSAGNTPLGVPGVYELIGTPKQLAQFQSVKWMERNIILPNAMSTICLVSGDKKLEASYNKEKKKIQQLKEKQAGMQRKNSEELAMRLLAGHLIEFSPNLSKEKEKENAFGIKKELYRPFQEILGCLSLLYNLKEKNTFGRISELAISNIISHESYFYLDMAIKQVLSLRLQAHLFYKDEKEFLCHAEEGRPQDPSLYYFNEQNIKSLGQIYMVLLPFHKAASEFYQSGNKEILNKSTFFDDSPNVRAVTFEKTLQYAKAHEAYQQAVSLNPNDIHAQLYLGLMEATMGKAKEALPRFLKALSIAQEKHGENHPDVACSYSNIGAIYDELGDYNKALDYLLKALKIRLQVLDENHPDVGLSYNAIGMTYQNIKESDKALEFFQKALKIWLRNLGENHSCVAAVHNNMGSVYNHLGEYEKALFYHQDSLRIWLPTLPENHPHIAKVYNNVAGVYTLRGEYDKALEFFQKALKSRLPVLGENHLDIAHNYHNIGSVYFCLKDYHQALEFTQKTLKIRLELLGENHLSVAQCYKNMGDIFNGLGDYEQALEFTQKTLKIRLELLGENHLSVAQCYETIGSVYENMGDYERAFPLYQIALEIKRGMLNEEHSEVTQSTLLLGSILGNIYQGRGDVQGGLKHHQETLKIRLQLLEENHPDIAKSYHYLGDAYRALQDYEKALSSYCDALKIRLQVLHKNHPHLVTTFIAISTTYQYLGNFDKALEFYQNGLNIRLQVLGENHPLVATSFNNISALYKLLGDLDNALKFDFKALNIKLKVLDENHSSVATSYNNIGVTYENMGDFDKSLRFYQKALKIWLEDSKKNYTLIEGLLNALIAHAKGASLSQITTIQEVCTLCKRTLREERLLILTEQLTQAIQLYY